MVISRGFVEKRLSFFIFACILSLSVVLAAHIARDAVSNSTVFGSSLEDTMRRYNVTINNSDSALAANITQVNITLPTGFTFALNSNFTTGNSSFRNVSSVLSWTNSSALVMNLSVMNFVFNATADTPGNFTFVVVTLNATGAYNSNNLTIVINDTTSPSSVTFVSPSNASTVGGSSLAINVTATDNGVIKNITIQVFNSTGSAVATANSSLNQTGLYNNFTDLSQGTYIVNASVWDTYNNFNFSTLTVSINSAGPTVTITNTSTERNSISFSVSGTDSFSTVTSCSITTTTGGHISGSSVIDLDCGNSYDITASCTNDINLTSSATSTFSTLECSGGGSSGGSGSSSSLSWSRTYSYHTMELSDRGPLTSSLKSKERVSLKIDGSKHYVGVASLGSTSVTLEIESTPQSVSMNVGDTKKFDFNNDGYYDFMITLNSITAGAADLAMVAIHEIISSSTSSQTGSAIADQPGETASGETQRTGSMWLYVLIIALVLVVALGYMFMRSKRK